MFTNDTCYTGTHVDFFGIEDRASNIYGMTEEEYEFAQDFTPETDYDNTDTSNNTDAELPFDDSEEDFSVASESPIYQDFILMGEHFTVEDYDTTYAVFHEDMPVKELDDKNNKGLAHEIARQYLFQIRK